jgi:hypothetical protein
MAGRRIVTPADAVVIVAAMPYAVRLAEITAASLRDKRRDQKARQQ